MQPKDGRFRHGLAVRSGVDWNDADKGASLQVLDPAIDTSQPIGRLLFNMIGAVAQFERERCNDHPANALPPPQTG